MLQKKIVSLIFLINIYLVKAQNIDPLRAKDVDSQEAWVNNKMKSLSIDEKIGQLFMIQAYSNKDAKHENHITEMIEKYHVGNLIFMQGTPDKQVSSY